MTEKYHISSKIIHWLMALIIISLLGVGIYMTNFLPKDALNRGEIYALHKSFGVIALILIFFRIFNKIIQKKVLIQHSIPKFQRVLAYFIHYLLYLLMLIIPFSGYLMSNSYGYDVFLFSIKMPKLIQTNYEIAPIFSSIHEFGAYLIICALILHIGGALKHRFFDKKENDVLSKMI